MYLKSEPDIAKAMKKGYDGVSKERKETLLAHLRAASARHKLNELHLAFTAEEGGLPKEELAFYTEVVEVEGNEAEKVNAQPFADANIVAAEKPSTPQGANGSAR